MSNSPTSICNQALARLGAKRINDFDDASDTKLEAVYCRLFYEQTVRVLTRSHLWRFAKARAQLSQDTEAPEFQWAYSYSLPADVLRPIRIWNNSDQLDGETYYSHELEGMKLLMDESTVYLKYIRWVEEVPSWDALFADVMILSLAKKLVIPLSQDLKLKTDINNDLFPLMRQVRTIDRQEMEKFGRADLLTWRDARFSDIA